MKILRNILVVIAGIIGGSIINMGVLTIAPYLVDYPEGFDNSTSEALASTLHLLQPKHFLFVFLSHGLGTLAGAYIAAKIAASRQLVFASIIGILFFLGGVYMMSILPSSPTWYNITELIGAYIPMTWIGWKLAGSKK